jgi:hypothetical protein
MKLYVSDNGSSNSRSSEGSPAAFVLQLSQLVLGEWLFKFDSASIVIAPHDRGERILRTDRYQNFAGLSGQIPHVQHSARIADAAKNDRLAHPTATAA